MKVVQSEAVALQAVEMEGAKAVSVRQLITAEDGAPHFAMRRFELAPGGQTPLHEHPWEHEVYVLAGEGELRGGEAPRPLRAGAAVFVPAGERHQFANTGEAALTFL